MATTPRPTVRIAADVGGTFTDVILLDDRGGVRVHKLPSTPPDFERAVLDAVQHLLSTADIGWRGGEVVGWVNASTTPPPHHPTTRGADVAEVAHAPPLPPTPSWSTAGPGPP